MSRWNIVRIGHVRDEFTLGMSISCCLSPFCWYWVSNAKAVSGGIWALISIMSHTKKVPIMRIDPRGRIDSLK